MLVALGLLCCTCAFSRCSEQACSLIALHRPLPLLTSLVAAVQLVGFAWTRRRSCGPCIGRKMLFFFLTKEDIFIGKGCPGREQEVKEPRRIALPCRLLGQVLW